MRLKTNANESVIGLNHRRLLWGIYISNEGVELLQIISRSVKLNNFLLLVDTYRQIQLDFLLRTPTSKLIVKG